MRCSNMLMLTLVVAGSMVTACRDAVGSNPLGAPSDMYGTSSNYQASEAEVVSALTNGFPAPHWVLDPAVESGYLVPGWHPTNGFVLFSIDQTVTHIQLNDSSGTWVPYIAYFHIVTSSAHAGNTK